MKKFILTSCLSFITMSMFAFTPLRFGAQIGVNSNKTDKDNISNGGYSLGIFTEIPTIGQLYLCPGLNFTQKTSTLSYKNIGFGGYYVGKDELKINYLEIPILFKYFPNIELTVEHSMRSVPVYRFEDILNRVDPLETTIEHFDSESWTKLCIELLTQGFHPNSFGQKTF